MQLFTLLLVFLFVAKMTLTNFDYSNNNNNNTSNWEINQSVNVKNWFDISFYQLVYEYAFITTVPPADSNDAVFNNKLPKAVVVLRRFDEPRFEVG